MYFFGLKSAAGFSFTYFNFAGLLNRVSLIALLLLVVVAAVTVAVYFAVKHRDDEKKTVKIPIKFSSDDVVIAASKFLIFVWTFLPFSCLLVLSPNNRIVWSKLFDIFSPLNFFSQNSCYTFLGNIWKEEPKFHRFQFFSNIDVFYRPE